MIRRNLKGFKVATMDFETDPFLANRVPKPFCGGFFDGTLYFDEWGDDCVAKLMERVLQLPDSYLIYFHNGAKFDFHFMYEYVEPPIFIKGGKLIEFGYGIVNYKDDRSRLKTKAKHIFRDSLSILPFALKTFQKTEIDYAKLEAKCRERNKREILDYLRDDCRDLFQLCNRFVNRFGPAITIGKVAITQLSMRHKFKRLSQAKDEELRPFYFGGRTQCFKSGILKGPWKVYDVNSQYPAAMRNYNHPVNGRFDIVDQLSDEDMRSIAFVEFDGRNRGALPLRREGENGITTDFEIDIGRFRCTTHELKIAVEHDLVKINKVHKVMKPCETVRFVDFVDYFYGEKVAAKIAGDKATELFSKTILNSCYGKFGQNPNKYRDYILIDDIFDIKTLAQARTDGYKPEMEVIPGTELWSRPAKIFSWSFFDVSIAASITSAARSIMLTGLQNASEPIYCDTDSVICGGFNGLVSNLRIGEWKYEGFSEFAAIAGKKTYSLYDGGKRDMLDIYRSDKKRNGGLTFKTASKGGSLTTSQIIALCEGGTVEMTQAAPTFKIGKAPAFVTRNFRATGTEKELTGELSGVL